MKQDASSKPAYTKKKNRIIRYILVLALSCAGVAESVSAMDVTGLRQAIDPLDNNYEGQSPVRPARMFMVRIIFYFCERCTG